MKIVSNQLSPNLRLRDFFTAVFDFSRPDFAASFGTKNFQLTNSARTALAEIIRVADFSRDKKIGIPAYICAVVATPFLAAGYEICWLDTDEHGLISVADFEQKSDQLAAVVVPHIFGQTAPVSAIAKIAREKKIFVIEDGAHFFQPGCVSADAKILSFGREKVYSCVSGGALVWPDDSPLADKFVALDLPPAKLSWSLAHFLQPFWLGLCLPIWQAGGRLLAGIFSRLRLLPRAVTPAEKSGSENFPRAALPRLQQRLLAGQLGQSGKIFVHRQQLAEAWQQTLSRLFPESEIILPPNYLRVILRTDRRAELLAAAKKIGFDLSDWEGQPIAPAGVDLARFGYTPGQCPAAEQFAQNCLTFPTNIRTSLRDVARFEKMFSKK